jgi:hypothetical protein
MTTAIDEMLLSAADVEIQATGKAPTVTIVAYTGGLMTVPGWGPIAIELAGIDTSAEQVGILADHNSSLAGIIGHGKAVVGGGRLLVEQLRDFPCGDHDDGPDALEMAVRLAYQQMRPPDDEVTYSYVYAG